VLSTIVTTAAAVGALFGVKKLGIKALDKLMPLPVSNKKLKGFLKLNEKLNNNKVLNGISEKISKIPSSMKEFSKTLLSWSPTIAIGLWLGHLIGHNTAKNTQFNRNYTNMKIQQNAIRESLSAEE